MFALDLAHVHCAVLEFKVSPHILRTFELLRARAVVNIPRLLLLCTWWMVVSGTPTLIRITHIHNFSSSSTLQHSIGTEASTDLCLHCWWRLGLKWNLFWDNAAPTVCASGETNQTIIWLIDKFSLFEINRYLINLYQTIQIIQKGDFWGENRRFLAF
jgi:hypothetical protein